MSVVKVQRTKSVAAAVTYVMHGTYANKKAGIVRAAAYSVVSGSMEATPEQFVYDTVAEIARHPRRTDQGLMLYQNFHPGELDKGSAFDVQLAQFAGQELARRVAPNSDAVVVTHTDSKSGHVHNHIIIANHDRVTGKTPRDARNFHKVKHFNDEVMRDLHLEVYEPPAPPPPPRGYSRLRGAPLPVITTENWRAELQQRVDAVLADSRVAAALTVADGLDVAHNIAAEYSVSFRVTTHEKKRRDDVTATTYALIDPGGEPVRYATGRGSRSTERTGSRLGKEDYTLDAVKRRIADRQQQYQQQQQQQQQLQQQHIKKFQEDDYAQAAQATTATATATPAAHTVGAAGADGASTLRDRYLDGAYIADTSAPASAETSAETAASSALPAAHTGADGRDSVDEPGRAGDGASREGGRGVGGSLREPRPSECCAVLSSNTVVSIE